MMVSIRNPDNYNNLPDYLGHNASYAGKTVIVTGPINILNTSNSSNSNTKQDAHVVHTHPVQADIPKIRAIPVAKAVPAKYIGDSIPVAKARIVPHVKPVIAEKIVDKPEASLQVNQKIPNISTLKPLS